jgi:NitT/TauT family transport system substrate-binding protein
MVNPLTPQLHRRTLLQRGMQLGVATALLGVQPSLDAQGVLKPTPDMHVAIGVQQTASLSNLPLLLAHELGFFKSEGIVLDWKPLASEAAGTQALAKGQIQMVSCDFAHTLLQDARGGELTAFVVQARTPQMVFGVLPRALVGYRQFSDLKGRRVCTLPPSVASQLVIHRLMQDAGLSGWSCPLSALPNRQTCLTRCATAVWTRCAWTTPWWPRWSSAARSGVVADTRTLKGTLEVFGGPMPGAVVCASAHYIQQHPAVCQGVANAVVRALKWLRTAGPSDLVKALGSVSLDADRVNYLTALEKSRDGFMGDGVLSDACCCRCVGSGQPHGCARATQPREADAGVYQRVCLEGQSAVQGLRG